MTHQRRSSTLGERTEPIRERAELATVRRVDNLDLDLDTPTDEIVRRRLLRASPQSRDEECNRIQQAAMRVPIPHDPQGRRALLMAMPVVAGYARATKLQTKVVLAHPRGGETLARRLQRLWCDLLPGVRSHPMSDATIRLDAALAADPTDVRACAREGAAVLAGQPAGSYSWRCAQGSRPLEVVHPVPGVYLLPTIAFEEAETVAQASANASQGVLFEVAMVLQGVFATSREVPTIATGPILPFFAATHAALAAQIGLASVQHPGNARAGRHTRALQADRSDKTRLARITLVEGASPDRVDLLEWRCDWQWSTDAALEAILQSCRQPVSADPRWVFVPGEPITSAAH